MAPFPLFDTLQEIFANVISTGAQSTPSTALPRSGLSVTEQNHEAGSENNAGLTECSVPSTPPLIQRSLAFSPLPRSPSPVSSSQMAPASKRVRRSGAAAITDTLREMVVKGEEFTGAILNFMRERGQAKPPFGTQDAIRILNDEYRSKLSAEEFLSAISIFKDQSNAAVFCMLGPGDMRERWLSGEMAKASRQ